MRILAIFVACVAASGITDASPITTGSLVGEMADMSLLTRFPTPGYKTVQFSSYDRSSSVPGGENWFANADGFGRERTPNFEAVIKLPEGKTPGEYLMCDVEGPGAIVRLWTAKIEGAIRVFLDGGNAPLYDGPAEDFLLHPYNTYLQGSGLTAEDLTGTFYQRNASYAPIPFAKRCKIVWVGNHKETHFYEIQIRKYDPGAEVVSFSPGDIKANADLIRQVASVFADPAKAWTYASTKEPVKVDVEAAPRSVVEALKLEGNGALERITLKVDAADIDRALRQTILHIQCDGYPWGQVQSPVGDFFGAGPGINPYTSVPFTVAPDGAMTCRYVMPFRESVRILFDNRGDQPVAISGSVLPLDYSWDDAASMHFRARWRVNHGLVASNQESMGVQDLPFLMARGQGLYVGTAVMLLNPNPVPTSWGNWWGEGDEKIFIDDDVRPSIFGTGSEDYFNYAWSSCDIFAFPYCGQPRNDGPANRGFVVNQRWHILDALPFTRSIAFYMELFSHERTEGVSYARLSYHYARPGVTDDHVTITDEDLRAPALPPTWEPAARAGAAKFTFVPCEDLVKDRSGTNVEGGGLWQGGRILVWTPAKAGDTLALSFNVAENGNQALALTCMFKPGAGTFRAQVDGHPILFDGLESVNLQAPYRVLSRMLGAEATQLKAGIHGLTLTAVEAGKPIGLDFLGTKKRP